MDNALHKLLVILFFILMTQNIGAFEKFDTSDGISIDYEVTGNGEPLVMLHSGMMSREDMRAQISYFSKNFQVIAIDSREQGRSSSSTTQISYDLMSKDVVELLDHLGIRKANLFGQSDGGITALLTTFNNPERVSKLVIHGAVYNFNAYSKDSRERWAKSSWRKDNPQDIDPEGFPGMAISHYLLGRKDLSNFGEHLKEMARMWATSPNLTEKDLNNIATPTLVIVGDHWDISLSHTIEMHKALKNSELFVVPGATHFVHQEKPDLLHLVMFQFLRK